MNRDADVGYCRARSRGWAGREGAGERRLSVAAVGHSLRQLVARRAIMRSVDLWIRVELRMADIVRFRFQADDDATDKCHVSSLGQRDEKWD